MLIYLVILACLIPIMSITFFVIGYNMHAPKKIFHINKKIKMTEDEKLLSMIDEAHF